jgi:hypothetical protein
MSATGVMERVAVDPIREAFERSGVSADEVARQLGWMRPDGTRVRRQLGLITTYDGRGRRVQQTIGRERALEIAEVLGVDPVDVGL